MNTVDQALTKLKGMHANELQHVNSDLEEHLKGTYDLLKNWGNIEYICLAGLYHAIYGTAGFPVQLVALDQRQEIAKIIGDQAEELVYFYGACDRSYTYDQIIHNEKPFYRDRFTHKTFLPSENLMSSFCELTLANELEIARGNKQFCDTYGSQLITLFDNFKRFVSIKGFKYFNDILKNELKL